MRPNVSFYVFYLLLLGLGVACMTCVCYWITQWQGGFAWDGTHQQFNWHPALMVTGLVVFYGYGEHFLLCCAFRVLETNSGKKGFRTKLEVSHDKSWDDLLGPD